MKEFEHPDTSINIRDQIQMSLCYQIDIADLICDILFIMFWSTMYTSFGLEEGR